MEMADRYMIEARGHVYRVEILIQDRLYKLEYAVLDHPLEGSYLLLLGRHWLHVTKAMVNWDMGGLISCLPHLTSSEPMQPRRRLKNPVK